MERMDKWEMMSAMQKCIRRALPGEAMCFFLLLEREGLFKASCSRLNVIAHEDIGIASPGAVTFTMLTTAEAEKWYDKGKGSWRLMIANTIRVMARADKSREADTFQAAMRLRLHEGRGPSIPDFALDKHTARGRKLGRGIDHFLEEGAKLIPDTDPHQYDGEAREFWERKLDKAEGPNSWGANKSRQRDDSSQELF